MHVRLLIGSAILATIAFACGGGSDSGNPAGPSTPTPTTHTLTGQVINASNGQSISGATVRVTDGPNAGKSATTNGSGSYTISGLQTSGFTASASADYYNSQGVGVNMTSDQTANFRLEPIPLFTASGTGDNVFDIPGHVRRIKITGDYNRSSSNFVVYIAGRLVVNELLGTYWGQPHFEGVYTTSGGTAEIKISSGVRWSFTEVR